MTERAGARVRLPPAFLPRGSVLCLCGCGGGSATIVAAPSTRWTGTRRF